MAAACKLVIVSLDSSLRYNVQVEELREALELPKVLQFYVQRLHEVAKTCKDGEFAHYQNWLLAASVWFEKTYRAASMEVSSNAGAELSVEGLDFSDSSPGQYALPDPSIFGLDLDMTIEELMSGWMGPLRMGMDIR